MLLVWPTKSILVVKYMSSVNITPSISKENPLNKDICNAFGCSNKATESIEVSAGIFGTITLDVCQFCINKFQNKGDIKN